ncbi:MAG: FHA domain-containing protein [Anaerolineaceae bacterium]|nr:FHA domain-containing protein [Anaerolineaceae bacterium]
MMTKSKESKTNRRDLPHWFQFLFILMTVLTLPTQVVFTQEDTGDEDPDTASGSKAGILIDQLNTDQFPSVHFYMEAYDQDGRFIQTVYPSAIEILEDGQTIIAHDAVIHEPGLQLTVAVNPGVMYLNYYQGFSNWDRISLALQEWAQSRPPGTPDDFSLVGGETFLQTHYTSPRGFSNLFDEYAPNFMNELPSIFSLTAALELAAESTPDPYSKHSILYITPPMNEQLLQMFPPLIEQAEELGVQVNVWLVGTANSAESSSAKMLKEFAERTGGDYFLYTGLEFLPDLEDSLQPMRYYYDVNYASRVTQPGTHEVKVNLFYEDLELHSGAETFSVELSAPNPIFLAPPAQVEQEWTIPPNAVEAVLKPDFLRLNIMIEFTDGIQRPIVASRLFVDGEVLIENNTMPFDTFEWDISETEETTLHILQVEIEDSLGYVSRSIELPIRLIVGDKPTPFFANTRLVIAVSISVAAVILVLVMFLTGRKRAPSEQEAEIARRNQDPLTQPVIIREEPAERKERNHSAVSAQANFVEISPARLILLSRSSATRTQKVIVLNENEITIGSDERYATHVLNAPTINPLHARVYQNEQKEFIVADCDSLAGTWLNYAPVTERGAHLKDGDLLQLGQEVFRFEQATYALGPSENEE